ncbi:alpha-N-acetylglucosaminidase [Mucilaginibacter rubeus]|uniref:Alpha-N-acetylglucosaminidase n=1 Tax=Mucilaginibacter rubeus TaxID=2027860 RepID=A0AAE6JKV5_9SPHI|nr:MULTISPECIES: alpha-N-acetylglucosaminidase [Mucilaginibacter]QEM07782.1 alpha-N-acetylglucosaminidase [Mucilaginibacter rubeus]QEM20235.1 alpha-N-acetylglucosaminidase [Mucilaginibacter gossypii]QTE43048.1 alpha-N-acetylglucosaminidase [Mucilaginibacter rubeus]QTE49649.1 alpha-N-acetylglucosaminidase [Mucilaginibacter rubeus]QTE54744.1 alpha-N-acetylglucosaminidase [Mucilaginibacter rubeus]
MYLKKHFSIAILSVLTFFLSLFNTAKASDGPNILEAQALINRVTHGRASEFHLQPITATVDTFYLANEDNKIAIKASSTIAMAKGFNYYLKNICHVSVTWYAADSVIMPAVLPKAFTPAGERCRFDNRFFLNYCTFGYTTVWWKWSDWQYFIDWMAMNGINMPLAITGQEYIWQRVWHKFGMTDEQSRAFFTGPVHLPWQRMGNLDRWQGPLPQSFIDGQFELQKKILTRERALGMHPILPAFAGHVPKDLKKKYPNIKLTDLGSYDTGTENDAYFLDPMDPLFVKIQKEYLSEQQKLLGTDHYYGADPFNEMDPPSWEPSYLAKTAATIYSGMKSIDPKAVWIQMGWTFYYDRKHWTNPRLEAMIKAVPQNHMMILDYFCEQTEVWRVTDGFFNAPYIWCYLGNFGGNTQLAAPVLKTAKLLSATEDDPNHRQMTGIGSTLEGFGVNEFMFEWLFDYAWNTDAKDPADWIKKYAESRCGHNDPVIAATWTKLLPVIYNSDVSGVGLGNIIQSKPMLKGNGGFTWLGKYNYQALANIFPQFLLADSASKANPNYTRDLAMLEKQVLVNLAVSLRDSVGRAYHSKNQQLFNKYTGLFLDLCDDVDRITATQHELLLGAWIKEARDFGSTQEEKNYYEKNARLLITTWGGEGNVTTDYAAKDWSGMISTYYKGRWTLFFNELRKTIDTGKEPDMDAFDKQRAAFDWKWVNTNQSQQPFKWNTTGDTYSVALGIYKKWAPYL